MHRSQDDDIDRTYRLAYLDRDIVHTVDLVAVDTYVLFAVRHETVAVADVAPYDDDACLRFSSNRYNIYLEAAKSITHAIQLNVDIFFLG